MSAQEAEQAVREFYAAYSDGDPDKFDEVVADDYTDYGHNPPGRGPQGAKNDFEHAVQVVGGNVKYDIDALVARDDGNVAVAWTGTLPNGKQSRGLSLYLVRDGKITETRHAAIGALPS
jgi:ketosteroid isomerase-like protein